MNKFRNRPDNVFNNICTMTMLLIFLLSITAAGQASDNVTQNFTLKPGWNAIYLEVQPENDTLQSVFSGIPVESVWTRSERTSAVQFLLDPSELDWNQAGWLGYRSDPDQAMLSNLFAITANQAYLVKLLGSNDVNLTVTGRPSTLPTRWVPQAYNLTGFHLDSAVNISLGDLLADSSAHAGEAIYALDPASQQWEKVTNPFSRVAQAGEAYWIYSAQASSFQGPWNVNIISADGVDFGSALNKHILRFSNVSTQVQVLDLNELPGSNSVGLVFQRFNNTAVTYEWHTLGVIGPLTVPVGGSVTVALGVERQNFGSANVSSVLEVNNGDGSRLLIPVRASR